jgi:hypothetical protein
MHAIVQLRQGDRGGGGYDNWGRGGGGGGGGGGPNNMMPQMMQMYQMMMMATQMAQNGQSSVSCSLALCLSSFLHLSLASTVSLTFSQPYGYRWRNISRLDMVLNN